MTDLAACEADPAAAYAVNARAVAILAESCRTHGCRLVQVSTDHYFTGDGAGLHDERSPVRFLNDYARSKFAGEAFALSLPNALVLRTNITGFRGWPDKPTFAEWSFTTITQGMPITLFDDSDTSTMDAHGFARALLTFSWKMLAR